MIATTINMHPGIIAMISHAASVLNTSRRKIIIRLLMNVMRNIDFHRRENRTVAYQPDNTVMKWQCFSIQFTSQEYEFFTDMRKLCKCSVSLLVAIAAREYIDQLIYEKQTKLHNYSDFSAYKIIKKIIRGAIIWEIHWGRTKKHTYTRIE